MTEAATAFALREAKPGDRPALVRFTAALNAVEHELVPDRALGEAAADRHLAYLEELVAQQEGFVLVAARGESLLGFLVAIVEEEEGHYVLPEARRFGYVTDLYVIEAARGEGVGRALMTEAEDRFRARGLTAVRVTALAANREACGTYEGLGYRRLAIDFTKPLTGR